MPPDKPGLVIKRHNIRIWCHDCDMARLQRVVWEGHGARLLSEVSNQPVVKKFLEAVPYLMNTIRDIHEAVIQNDLEGLMKHSGDPVTPQALSSRDANNMTALHKAAGLGHVSILKYIADRYPQGINDVDNDGRTPLHYAAIVRDEQHTFSTLVGLGADESVLDNKNKTPGYYINRPQEIDKNILKTLPDAPRTPSSSYPSSWDWKLLDTEVIAELNKKSRRKMKASSENISSKNNTTTISETIENKAGAMKNSSTHEFIKDLPDLDDNPKPNHKNGDTSDNKLEDSQIAEETDDVTENQTEDEEKEKQEEEPPEDPVEEKAIEGDDNHEEHKTENGEHHSNEEQKHENNEIDNSHKEEKDDEKHQDDEQKDEKNEAEIQNIEKNDEITETKDHLPDVVESHEEGKDKAEIEEITHDASEEHEPHDHEHLEQNEDDATKHANEEEQADTKEEESAVENHDEHNGESQVDENDELTHKNNDIHEIIKDTSNESEDEVIESPKEGNNKYDHNEDDDDVQVQGDAASEYSDTNLRSTAELSDTNSAKRGKSAISSGTIHEPIKT
ncbi:protein starmaker [Leguminivora glycinivorella]|uniref:protein starmaker n=1 Tax=Leguminivora glycinivorella TaxID=1035111 RepID=UPI00200EFBD5|nr:protein starmaker [Leguminivora glycinivorella]